MPISIDSREGYLGFLRLHLLIAACIDKQLCTRNVGKSETGNFGHSIQVKIKDKT